MVEIGRTEGEWKFSGKDQHFKMIKIKYMNYTLKTYFSFYLNYQYFGFN